MSVVDVERSAHDVITRAHVYDVTGWVGGWGLGIGMKVSGERRVGLNKGTEATTYVRTERARERTEGTPARTLVCNFFSTRL